MILSVKLVWEVIMIGVKQLIKKLIFCGFYTKIKLKTQPVSLEVIIKISIAVYLLLMKTLSQLFGPPLPLSYTMLQTMMMKDSKFKLMNNSSLI